MKKQDAVAQSVVNDGCRAEGKGSSPLLGRRELLFLAGASGLCLAFPEAAAAGNVKRQGGAFWQQSDMDLMTAIFTRRSIREFTGEPMPDAVLRQILAAGMNAPSAHNTQPWRFVVLRTKEELEHIPQISSYTHFALKASVAVMVCMQQMHGEWDELGLLSVACCAQNMLLACTALGYGGVWLQIYPDTEPVEAWRKVAGLPEDVVPVSLITMGKAVAAQPPVNRMDPEKIHYGVWNKTDPGSGK